jgi:hyperosmotically inducible periplasmic protein
MKIKLVTAGLLIGALVLPMAAQAGTDSDSDRSSPKAYVKDSIITTKIKAKFAQEGLAGASRIRVDTDDHGVVNLSGTAASRKEAARAVSIARGVEGVVSVEDDIKIAARR